MHPDSIEGLLDEGRFVSIVMIALLFSLDLDFVGFLDVMIESIGGMLHSIGRVLEMVDFHLIQTNLSLQNTTIILVA